MITFFNCGQGDSSRICFQTCCENGIPLYIDLGPSGFKKNINEPIIDICISHSHFDHLIGSIINSSKVRHIYVPAYLPELLKIKAVFNRRNINPYSGYKLLYEGKQIGNYSQTYVFNPPINPYTIFNYKEIDYQMVNNFLDRMNIVKI